MVAYLDLEQIGEQEEKEDSLSHLQQTFHKYCSLLEKDDPVY